LTSVNITSVSSTTKMNGELLLVQKDIHLSGVTVHLKNTLLQNPAQVNGLVKILNGLPPPIWTGSTKMVMVKSMVLITSEISLDYMNLVMLTVTNPSTSVNITSVSSTTKTLGELLLAQKDIHKSGVIVHSKFMKFQNPAQVNGLVTILNGSLPPISIT
jgi:5'-3' exonuclease